MEELNVALYIMDINSWVIEAEGFFPSKPTIKCDQKYQIPHFYFTYSKRSKQEHF